MDAETRGRLRSTVERLQRTAKGRAKHCEYQGWPLEAKLYRREADDYRALLALLEWEWVEGCIDYPEPPGTDEWVAFWGGQTVGYRPALLILPKEEA